MKQTHAMTIRLTPAEHRELSQLARHMRRSKCGTMREALREAARVIAEHRVPKPTDRIRIEAVQS